MVRTCDNGLDYDGFIQSQSPQVGAMVRTGLVRFVTRNGISLNPLKSGQWFGHWWIRWIRWSWSKSLNPLKSGQWFGQLEYYQSILL